MTLTAANVPNPEDSNMACATRRSYVHKQCEVDKHLKNGILTHKPGPIADEG